MTTKLYISLMMLLLTVLKMALEDFSIHFNMYVEQKTTLCLDICKSPD